MPYILTENDTLNVWEYGNALENIKAPNATGNPYSEHYFNVLETSRKYLDRNINIKLQPATITSSAATIDALTYTYQSANNRFKIDGSKSIAAPVITNIGFIDHNVPAGHLIGSTASVNTYVPRIGLTLNHTATGQTTAVTPTLSAVSFGNDTTLIDAAKSTTGQTSAPSSGVYVAVKSAANTKSLNITPTVVVSSAGYGTPDAGSYTTSATAYTVGANASATTYFPIKTTSRTSGDGILTLTAGAGSVTCDINQQPSTDPNDASQVLKTTQPSSGVYYKLTLTGSGTVSGSGSGKVSTGAGWVSSGETTSNVATDSTSSQTATAYRYITKSVTGSTITGSLPTSISPARTSGTYEDIEIQPLGYVKIPAGFYSKDRYIFANVADASSEARPASNFGLTVSNISGNSAVSTGTLSNGYYPITANNLSVTATLAAQEAGWFSTGSATDSDTDGVTVGKMAAAVLSSNASGLTATISVTPSGVSIANKTASAGNGKEQIAVSPSTATSGINKYYIAVNGTSAETTLTGGTLSGNIKTKVTTAGYAPQDTTGHTTGSVSGSITATAATKTGSTYYIPLDTATFKQDTNSFKSDTAGWVPANTTLLSMTTVPVVPDVSNTGLSTYFTSTNDDQNANVTLQPTYTTDAGYVVAATNQPGGTAQYYNIKMGTGTTNTANVVLSTVDSNSINGINVSGMVGTGQDSEPTSGYFLAFKGSGSSKISQAGWFEANTILSTTEKTKYFPLTQAGCTLSGGKLSKNDYSKTNLALTLASGNDTNMTGASSIVNSKTDSTYPYYFKVNGSTPAVSGSAAISVSAITKSHTAGYMPAQGSTQWKAKQDSSVSVSVNATSGSTYVGIKAASVTVSGDLTTGSYTNNISLSSGYANYGITTTQPSGTYVSFTPTTTITNPKVTPTASVNQAGYLTGSIANGHELTCTLTQNSSTTYYAPVVTPAFTVADISKDSDSLNISTAPTATISKSGTFFNSSKMSTYGIVTTAPSGGTDGTTYLTVDGTLSTTNGTATSAWGVTHASPTYTNNTKGLINIAAGTTISSTNKTASGGKSQSITVTPTDNFAPHYIPIVSPQFTGGAVSLSNDAAINHSSSTVAFGTSTSNGYLVSLSTTGSASHSAIKYANTYKGLISVTTSTTLSGITSTSQPLNLTKDIYIKKATPAFKGGTVNQPVMAMTGNGANSNIVLSDTNNGVAVVASASATRTAVTYNGAVDGYVKATNGATALAADNTGASNTLTKYIEAVRIPAPSSGTNTFTISVPNGSTDEYISFTFTVDSSGNTLIDGSIVYDGTYN